MEGLFLNDGERNFHKVTVYNYSLNKQSTNKDRKYIIVSDMLKIHKAKTQRLKENLI